MPQLIRIPDHGDHLSRHKLQVLLDFDKFLRTSTESNDFPTFSLFGPTRNSFFPILSTPKSTKIKQTRKILCTLGFVVVPSALQTKTKKQRFLNMFAFWPQQSHTCTHHNCQSTFCLSFFSKSKICKSSPVGEIFCILRYPSVPWPFKT